MLRKELLLLTLFSAISSISFSQGFLGIANSDYSAVDGMYINPSAIADSRYKFSFNIYAHNAFANNNQLKFDYPALIKDARQNDTVVLNNYLRAIDNKKVDLTLPFLEIRGPSMFYSFKNKSAVGLVIRTRLLNQFHDMDGHFYNIITQGLDIDGNSFNINSQVPYYWTSHLLTDLGLSYAMVVMNKGSHFLKAGVTAKLYRGNEMLYMNGNGINGTYYIDEDSLTIENMNYTLNTNLGNARSNELDNFNTLGGFFDVFFGKPAGSGFGGDIGFTYEYRPDTISSPSGKFQSGKYKYRLTFSVLDIGRVKYDNIQEMKVTGTGRIANVSDFNFANYDEVVEQLTEAGLTVTELSSKTVSVRLPTTGVFGADMQLKNRWYLNTTYLFSFCSNKNTPGNHYSGQISLIPRYQSKHFDAGLPLTYNSSSEDIKVGLGLRAGILTLGSDDLLGLISGESYGFNFYFGLRFNLHKK
jgi:hypothetical protein